MRNDKITWSKMNDNEKIAFLEQKINKDMLHTVAIILSLGKSISEMLEKNLMYSMLHVEKSIVVQILALGKQANELAEIINNQNKDETPE
jgi:hypothetical protein